MAFEALKAALKPRGERIASGILIIGILGLAFYLYYQYRQDKRLDEYGVTTTCVVNREYTVIKRNNNIVGYKLHYVFQVGNEQYSRESEFNGYAPLDWMQMIVRALSGHLTTRDLPCT